MEPWNNQVVVVTGGSEGFGRALGFAFASAGAKTVLLARKEKALREACESGQGDGRELDWVMGDVTDDQSVEEAVAEVLRRYGRIDVWVNNVGKSARTKFETCGVDQYRELMALNCYSAIRCTLAALDAVTSSSGQIVNIGSLAAKTGWPNVAPYAVSKHALAAFSHQFRIEGPANVNCLFVCTGPIRRTDANHRYQSQTEGLDEVASQPGAGVKLKGIDPDRLAQKIVRACQRRRSELVYPWFARILFSLAQLSPALGDFILRRSNRKK